MVTNRIGNDSSEQVSVNGRAMKKVAFYNDSGANRFVIIDETLLFNSKVLNPPIEIGMYRRETSILATKVGTLYVITDQGVKLRFDNVFYTPEGRCNILPIPLLQYVNIQFKIEFFKAYLYYKDKNTHVENTIAVGDSVNDTLYKFWFNVHVQEATVLTLSNFDQAELLHKKFGHLNYQYLKLLFPELKINQNKLCEVCLQAKQTRKPLNDKKDRPRSSTILENVHSDLKHYPVVSFLGEKYWLTFVDEFSHYTNIFILKEKSETFNWFQYYLNRMKMLYNRPGISFLYCDNGGEYLSNEFQKFMKSQGSDYKTTIRGTPALNGISERMQRTISEKTAALLFQAGLPSIFWPFAALTAVYLINRSPTAALPGSITPFEQLTGKKPDFSNLQIFGSVAHVKILTKDISKPRSVKCIFLGYSHNGYKLMRLSDCKLLPPLRDVDFEKDKFFKDLSPEERSLKNLSKFMSNCNLNDMLNSPILSSKCLKTKTSSALIDTNPQPSTSSSFCITNQSGQPGIQIADPRSSHAHDSNVTVPQLSNKTSGFIEHSYSRTKPAPAKKIKLNYNTVAASSQNENLSHSSELDFLTAEYQNVKF